MRINVYSQEVTKEIQLVSKTSDNGITHYGLRFYMASPDMLHHTPDDDDRSAVTFWVPNCGSFTAQELGDLFRRAADIMYRNQHEIARHRTKE